MIESAVAVSIGLVGLLGFLYLLTQSIGIARDAGTKLTATYLAAEGVEAVKGIVDMNHVADRAWNTGLDDDTGYGIQYDSTALLGGITHAGTDYGSVPLKYDSTSGLYGYDSGTGTPYQRSITIANLRGSEELRVVSTVTWAMRGGGTDSVSVEEHFFDWRPATKTSP